MIRILEYEYVFYMTVQFKKKIHLAEMKETIHKTNESVNLQIHPRFPMDSTAVMYCRSLNLPGLSGRTYLKFSNNWQDSPIMQI